MDPFRSLYPVSYSAKVECFVCDYCPETFSSKSDRIIHTSIHFTNKSCSNCGQILIRINDEWYGMHNSQNCGQQYGSAPMENPLDLNVIKKENEANEHLNMSHGNGNCVSGLEIDCEKMAKSLPIYLLPDNDPKPDFQSNDDNNVRCIVPKQKRQRNTKKCDVLIETMANIQCDNEIKEKKRQPPTKFMDHRPSKNITCDLCNKLLANYNTLRAHMFNMHIQRKRQRYPCTECDLTLASPGILKAHMRIHWESKAFVCTYCGRGFNQLYNLKEHINYHTGQKPYACQHCNKTFGRKTNLVSHGRIHTGEKPCKCTGFPPCERAYMFEVDLKRHRFSAHGIYTKKHICPIPNCSRVFPEKKFLKKHLESHAGFS